MKLLKRLGARTNQNQQKFGKSESCLKQEKQVHVWKCRLGKISIPALEIELLDLRQKMNDQSGNSTN